MGIIAGDARQARIDDHGDPVDRQGSFCHIRRNDDLAGGASRDRLVLLGGRKLAMQGQQNAAAGHTMIDFPDSPLDFISARHKDEDVAVSLIKVLGDGVGGEFPRRIVSRIVAQVLNLHRVSSTLTGLEFTGSHIALQLSALQRCRHDDNLDIRARRILELESAGQADIAEEVTLVKLVENERRDSIQLRIDQHLPKQDAFCHEKNPCFR